MKKRCEECGQVIQVEKYEIDKKTTKTVLSCKCRVMGVICKPDIPVEIPWGVDIKEVNHGPCEGPSCFYRKFFDKHENCKCKEEENGDDDKNVVLVYKDSIEDFLERARELRYMANDFIEDFEEILTNKEVDEDKKEDSDDVPEM